MSSEQQQEHQQQQQEQQGAAEEDAEQQQEQDLRPRKWFVSLSRGQELSEAEKAELRSSLREEISPWEIGDGTAESETREYLDLIDEIVEDTSNGLPPSKKCRKLTEDSVCSFLTSVDIEQCVRRFLADIGEASEGRVDYVWARPTTRLQDHLRDMNIDRGAVYDIEDCEEFEILCDGDDENNDENNRDVAEYLSETLSFDGFTALFDLYYCFANKVMWISPDAFVFMGIYSDFFGGYIMRLCVQDDYIVYGRAEGEFSSSSAAADKMSDTLLTMASGESDRDHIYMGGMKNIISPLSVNADRLEDFWGPPNCPYREIILYGLTLTPEQTLAMMRPTQGIQNKLLLMRSCHFQDGGLTFLDCVRRSQTPASLDLRQSPSIRYGAFLHLAAAIRVNTTLTDFKVSERFLSVLEISALFAGVVGNQTLERLQLEAERGWCPQEHWPAFCQILRVHPRIRSVSLSCKTKANGDDPEENDEQDRQREISKWTNAVADAAACSKTLTQLELRKGEHDKAVYESRIEPVLAVNEHRPKMRDLMSGGNARHEDAGTSRRRHALFGLALAAMANKERHAADLVFYALTENTDIIIADRPREEGDRKRPPVAATDQCAKAAGENHENKRRKLNNARGEIDDSVVAI